MNDLVPQTWPERDPRPTKDGGQRKNTKKYQNPTTKNEQNETQQSRAALVSGESREYRQRSSCDSSVDVKQISRKTNQNLNGEHAQNPFTSSIGQPSGLPNHDRSTVP